MACIDRIYLKNKKQFIQFYEWCEMFDDFCIKDINKSILDCFYIKPYMIEDNKIEYMVTNTPICVDEWLWKHCPLPFIRQYMSKNWGYTTKNKNKWLFYIERSFDREQFRNKRTLKAISEEIKDEYISDDNKNELIDIFNRISNGECRYKFINQLSKIYYGQLIY